MSIRARQSYSTQMSWIEVPDTIGTDDPLHAEIEVANTGDPIEDNPVYVHLEETGGSWTLNNVSVASGETITLVVSLDAGQFEDLHNNQPGTYTLVVGISLPGDHEITHQVEVVEGTTGPGEPGEPDPGLVSITDCGLSPTTVEEGENLNLTATVQNDNDVRADVGVAWVIGNRGFGASALLGANQSLEVTATFPMNEFHIAEIGGLGDYQVTATIDRVDPI